MINLTTRIDPASGLWQFQIIHKGHTHWSRPMTAIQLEKLAAFFYNRHLNLGKPKDQFFLATQDIIALINQGAITPKKVEPTSPTLKKIAHEASEAYRLEQANRWAPPTIKQSVDELLAELGL